jgi:hypothetical protein
MISWDILNRVEQPVTNGRAYHVEDVPHAGVGVPDAQEGPTAPTPVVVPSALPRLGPEDEIFLLMSGLDKKVFQDQLGRPFMFVKSGGRSHLFLIGPKNKKFTSWIRTVAKEGIRKIPSDTTVENLAALWEHDAEEGGVVESVYYRVAHWTDPETQADKILLDLCNHDQEFVEVGSGGWKIRRGECPVYFHRTDGMKPLPTPKEGGNLRELQTLLNLGDEANYKKAVGWLLATMSPRGPYPVLVISGPDGSAKSTAARELRTLVDPYVVPLLRPSQEDKLLLAAKTSWVVAVDNVSDITPTFSDALCRLATGSGDIKRKLYENDEPLFSYLSRPVVLNGIPDGLVSRPDLLSRMLGLNLGPIEDKNRRLERDVIADTEAARPRLLGALLDAVSAGLKHRESTKLKVMPRMADLAQWVESCVPALDGWQPGDFTKLLLEDRKEQDGAVLDEWCVFPVLEEILHYQGAIDTTMGGLLEMLTTRAGNRQKSWDWPKTAKGLGAQISRNMNILTRAGYVVLKPKAKSNKGQKIIIFRAEDYKEAVEESGGLPGGGEDGGEDPSGEVHPSSSHSNPLN